MKWVSPALVSLFCVPYCVAQDRAVSTSGPCSPVVINPKGDVTIKCPSTGLTPDEAKKQAKEYSEILNRIRQQNLSLQDVIVRLDSIRSDIQGIKAESSSRYLSEKQKKDLIDISREYCKGFPHVDVTAANGNQEAQRYGMDFVEAFRTGGCSADLSLPIPGLLPNVEGVQIGVRMPGAFATTYEQLPENARKLHLMFDGAQLKHGVHPLTPDFFPGNEFVIVIGAKPR